MGSKTTGYKEAIRQVGSVRLLRKSELLSLFKNGSIIEEKFLGLTKSYIMYK